MNINEASDGNGLTDWKYRRIRKAVRSISGTFRTKDVAGYTKYDRILVRAAFKRLQKEGEIIS